MAGFILHKTERGNVFLHAHHELDAHIPDGLHEEGQCAFLGDPAVVFGDAVEIAALAWGQGDDGVRRELIGLARIAARGFAVRKNVPDSEIMH